MISGFGTGWGGRVQRFRGGLLFKAHRLVYHSILALRVTKTKKRKIVRKIPFEVRCMGKG
jgi:hypothetical protein